MIKDIDVSMSFQGKLFSPREFNNKSITLLSNPLEVGELGKYGRYKNKPMPYGSGIFEVPKSVDASSKLLWLINKLPKIIELALAAGADRPTEVSVLYYCVDQCNLSLSKEEMGGLSNLGLDYWFSCVID